MRKATKKAILDSLDITILLSLKTYHFLTAEQITRLHFSRGSIKHVKSVRLKWLVDEHYLTIIEQQMPYVYYLDTRGVRFLREQGADMTGYYPSDHKTHANIFLDHLMKTNDVLISAALLPSVLPAVTSLSILHDLTLKRMYQSIRPDGWVGIEMNNQYIPLWIEIDMGTMDQKPFRTKIRRILEFVRSGYEQVFGTAYITAVFLTSKGERRVDQMLRWTENELTALGEAKEYDLFRFGEICDDPLKLFTSQMHRIPYTSMYTSLL